MVVGLALLGLMIGSVVLTPAAVLGAMFAPSGSESDLVVTGVRLPRVAIAVAVGAALAVAGVVMQALTRNPLAEPGILGVNAGASFAVTLSVTLLGVTGFAATLPIAFAGAAMAGVAVAALGASARSEQSSARLLLGGVAVGALLAGASAAMSMVNPAAYGSIRQWEAGSLAGRDLPSAAVTLSLVAIGVVAALALTPTLDVLVLGEDTAASLGARVRGSGARGLFVIVLLCGTATAAAGPIAFVGLMVPHLVRAFVGADQRRAVAYSLLAGPALMLLADLIARTVIAPEEVPVGVVTAALGAPLLIALVTGQTAAIGQASGTGRRRVA